MSIMTWESRHDNRDDFIQGLDRVPNELRKRYGLRTGDKVALVDYGGVLAIVPALKNPVEEAAGSLKGERSLTRALLEESAKAAWTPGNDAIRTRTNLLSVSENP